MPTPCALCARLITKVCPPVLPLPPPLPVLPLAPPPEVAAGGRVPSGVLAALEVVVVVVDWEDALAAAFEETTERPDKRDEGEHVRRQVKERGKRAFSRVYCCISG